MGCCGEATRIHSEKAERRAALELEDFNGPVRDRHCRDVFFLFLFAAFCAFLGYVIVTAVLKGDPVRLLHGYDTDGNVCGQENYHIAGANGSGRDMSNKPYLMIRFLPSFSRTCVDNCSNYNSQPTALWRCIPKEPSVTVLLKYFNVTRTFIEEMGSDVCICWREIIYICLSAFGLALVLLILFRFLAGVIIWMVLIAISLACLAGTAFMWYTWLEAKGEVPNLLDEHRKYNDTETKGWLAGAIAGTIITIIYLLVVLVMRSRIQLLAALFKEAGKALAAMPLLLVQPMWTFIFLLGICVGWVVAFAYIYTAEDISVDERTGRVTYQLGSFYQGMLGYHVFALFWLTQFVICCQHVVIAGAVSKWFFARNKDDLKNPISTSFFYLVRYHLGSVALGSLLIAVVKFVRALLKWLERQLGKYEVCAPLLKCCNCCLWCFEKFLKFLNRNAFIEIAIYSYAFCKGAQQALHVLAGNALRVAAISSVGDFVLFLGKVGVTVSTAFIGYEIVKNKAGVNYVWVPITIGCIFAFLVAHCFMAVYEMAIDTLFLCFCEDCERNDGIRNPFYMNKGLMAFVERSKKVMGMKDLGGGRRPGS